MALRRQAEDLLNQQLWCFGWDIRNPDGNLLLKYGFERFRPPDGTEGSSYYVINLETERQIGLWGFALQYRDRTLGSILLKRFQCLPLLMPDVALPDDRWHLPDFAAGRRPLTADERERVWLLTRAALGWLSNYESWIAETQPSQLRQESLAYWERKRKPIAAPAGETALAWHALAEQCRPLCAGPASQGTPSPEGQER
jgi:hypothetical protein